MDKLQLNIALSFNEEDREFFRSTAKMYASDREVEFLVGEEPYIPHVTLYQNQFPNKNIGEVQASLDEICKQHDTLTVFFLRPVVQGTSVWLQFAVSPELINLQRRVRVSIQELREDLIEEKFSPDNENYQEFSLARQKDVDEFGHPYYGNFYDPHVTLIRFVDVDDAYSVLRNFQVTKDVFEVNAINMFEGGEHGTCKRVISTHNLR